MKSFKWYHHCGIIKYRVWIFFTDFPRLYECVLLWQTWDTPCDGFICQIYSCLNNLTCRKTTTLRYSFRILITISPIITNSIAWRIWISTILLFLLINYSNHDISGWSFNNPNFKAKRLIVWYCSIREYVLSRSIISNVLNNFIVIVNLKPKIIYIRNNFSY